MPWHEAWSADSRHFADNYNVQYVTMRDGLVSSNISDLYQDSDGFLWITSMGGGLTRYDGYNFVNFTPNSSRYNIKSVFARGVTEDQFQRLWVTSEAGVNIIDLKTLHPAEVKDADNRLNSILNTAFTNISTDSKGRVWLSTPQSITRISFDGEGAVNDIQSVQVAASHLGVPVFDVNGQGQIMGGYGGTLYVIEDASGRLNPQPISDKLRNLPQITYFSGAIMRDNELWVSTDGGLLRYDNSKDQLKHYVHDSADHNSLSQNYLSGLTISPDKQLIVSSLRGLNIYNPFKDNFDRLDDKTRLLNNQFIVKALSIGPKIVVGTDGGGVNILTPRDINMNFYVHSATNPASLSPNPVNAIAEDGSGNLWVGTVEGGLNRMQPGSADFSHITMNHGGLSHNSVSAIAFDGEGNIWTGTWGGGVDVLDAKNPTRVIRRIQTLPGTKTPTAFIGSLTYDKFNDGVLIACESGLFFFDCKSGEMTNALDNPDGYPMYGFIGADIDGSGNLWQGCSNGLYVVNLRRRKPNGTFIYKYLRNKLDEPDGNTVEKVGAIFVDSKGTIWIGSNGYGLYKRTIAQGEEHYINYNTSHGLANNSIRGITEDRYGNLWIATLNGLSRFIPSQERFVNYTVDDGLPTDQFYWNGAYSRGDGTLLFGTSSGLMAINSLDTISSSNSARVIFSRLYVGNQAVDLPAEGISGFDISHSPQITIHEGDKSFGVEFAALAFGESKNAEYSYRLDGFDKDWIEVKDNRRFASYTNLSPGKYTLQVRYSPDGSDEKAQIAELKVEVKSYFYRSLWFLIVCALGIITITWLLYKWRLRDLTRQKARLTQEVEKRTAQLADQKKIAEQRASELSEQNIKLTEQNDEISRQKTQLTEMNRHVTSLTLERLSFFTNITHEFRTPITLIIGPIERALKLSTNPKVIEQLHFVERNSKYLLTLVNQLMDFRKLESGKLTISRTEGNFANFLHDLVTPFDQLAAERGIKIRRVMHLPHPVFVYDEESLRKVLTNLLANAIKFTPDNGHISLYVSELPPAEGDTESVARLYLGVCDSGNGIAPDELNSIFERFHQGSSQIKYPLAGTAGSGIGLYLCRSIMELLGGSITVRNNHGAGCTFRALLPITAYADSKAVAETALQAAPAPDEAENHQETTVLVVEDNNDMRAYIRSILSEHYTVLEAANGAEAMKILMDRPVDLIVSDLMMPVMDGLELSKRVKENFAISHIPFIMLTAKNADKSRKEGYRIGIDDYLVKPFDEEILLARIEGILRTRRNWQSRFNSEMKVDLLNIANESRDKKFMDQVMDVCKSNYKNPYFEVGDFAESIGISRSLLNKKLQSIVGQSAGQFIRNYRMNVAKELIVKNRSTHAMNISEIAYEVGFNDSKYFTRCFTKHYNTTPSAMLSSDAETQQDS